MLTRCYDHYSRFARVTDRRIAQIPDYLDFSMLSLFNHWCARPQIVLILQPFKWLAIGGAIGLLTGTSSAILLAALAQASDWRSTHPWLLWLLPLGGLVSGLIYHYLGQNVAAGNHLILAEIYRPRQIIPLRMAPLILIATTIAHIFGASVGREGTAVQMGGALADRVSQLIKLRAAERRLVLIAGISGGVASVFGTPLAGIVFGLEVAPSGRFNYAALLPCTIAAIVGNLVTGAWGIHRSIYTMPLVPKLTTVEFFAAIAAGIACGLTARAFVLLTERIRVWIGDRIVYPPLRPCLGGIALAIVIYLVGAKFSGLGVPTIVSAFRSPLPPTDFALKLVVTALSLGVGFKGGEVTPLFFIGATLGNALSLVLPLPLPLLAGMGFVAVFAGAAKTPLASSMMAIELFGAPVGIYAAIACLFSYLCSGRSGIYQKFG